MRWPEVGFESCFVSQRQDRDVLHRQKFFQVWRACAVIFLFLVSFNAPAKAAPGTDTGTTALESWWNGKYGSGTWFGVRDELAERGLKLEGRWKGAYYGVIASQGGEQGFFDQELALGATLNFGELADVDALDSLMAFGEVRWRDPARLDDPNTVVLASNLFNPSPYESGVGWRLVQFGLKYTSPDIFGAKQPFTLTSGWMRPYREFLVQPLSVSFLNTAIQLAKGLGGNIPFSSSFSSWGGVIEAKPVSWHYAKAGLFMSYPEATFSSNNGLMMQGYAPDPSQNGLYFLGETGFTPQIGSSKLPGKYAFGTYYYGENSSVYGCSKYGFYWQADQMLYREGLVPHGSSAGKPSLNEQGLRMFSMATFAPPYNNRYPFYAHAGLVYEGLIPHRDKDQLMGAVAVGQYANSPGRTYTSVVEWGYRINLNSWAYFQPDAQYIIRPDGTSNVRNAAMIGFFAGVNF